MRLGSATLADVANDDARDISGHALARIEELIAGGAIGDALNALQDMVRDFAREEMRAVLALGAKYTAVQNSNNRSLVVGLREEILDLAYRVASACRSRRSWCAVRRSRSLRSCPRRSPS
jgi:hypothetical protein